MTHQQLDQMYLLKNIVRYNTRPKLTNETVAEHSFFVALIALLISDERKLSDSDKLKVLIKALLHDMPEIELNDITHDVKVRLNLYEYLKKYEADYYAKEFPQYLELMTDTESNISKIVDLADAWSVVQFTNAEIKLGNSSEVMQEIHKEAMDRVVRNISDYEWANMKGLKKNEVDL